MSGKLVSGQTRKDMLSYGTALNVWEPLSLRVPRKLHVYENHKLRILRMVLFHLFTL